MVGELSDTIPGFQDAGLVDGRRVNFARKAQVLHVCPGLKWLTCECWTAVLLHRSCGKQWVNEFAHRLVLAA